MPARLQGRRRSIHPGAWGRAAIVACALVSAPPAPAQAAPAIYGGFTLAGRNQPVVIVADADRRHVTSVVISWRTTCQDHRVYDAATLTLADGSPGGGKTLGTSRNANGSFAGVSERSLTLADGQPATVRFTMSGTITKRVAAGTFQAEVLTIAGASTNGGCRTATYRWGALREPGRMFAGATSQDEPVVVRLSSDHKSVDELVIGWDVPVCRPEEAAISFQFGDFLTNFPIDHGVFSDTFDQRYHLDKDTDAIYDYEVHGQLMRGTGTARGRFAPRLSLLFFDSALMLVCDADDLTWHAQTG